MSDLINGRGLCSLAFLLLSGAAAGQSAPAVLSQTLLYENIATKEIHQGVSFYAPQYPLWSDGADKTRWIYLPEGSSINNTDENRWDFPIGTKFWKEFKLNGRRLETRYLEKYLPEANLASWIIATYQWNAEETEATLVSATGIRDAGPTEFPGISFDIPSKSACETCHERGGDPVLSFDALQLSTDRDPNALHSSPGRPLEPNQLTIATLIASGRLSKIPEQQPRIQANTPVSRSFQGYLHGNCGGCHNEQGEAGYTGLYLRYDLTSAGPEQTPFYSTAVNKLTTGYVVPGRTFGVDSYRVEGQSVDFTALKVRMTHRIGYPQMPPIGTKATDSEAIGLLSRLIRQLPAPVKK